MKSKFLSLFLAVCMILTAVAVFASCTPENPPEETVNTQAPNSSDPQESTPETNPVTAEKTDVRFMVLNGTTGFGIAPLMDKNAKGEASNKYTFSVETDASNITAALINGSVDMAALPTNAAAALNAKKPGAVQVVAVNTLGVLYLMTGEGETITSMEDLRGKTVYCPAQNPSFIFTYLCKANGLEPGTDVTIDTSYAQPADLRTALVAGQVEIAVLPEPMVTIAKSANDKLSVDLDLTAEWDKCTDPGSLAQGCIVVRTAFAQENPGVVKAFLAEYETSINFVKENPAEAGAIIAEQGVFAQAAVATKAIPNCNICFLAGEDMKTKLTGFYTVLHSIAPAAVGNAVPGDDLYFIVAE